MNYPKNYYFTPEHEWVNIVDDDTIYIGLTELAIQELKSIKSIEVHTLDQTLEKDQVFARVKSDRYLCKLIMPFGGTITEINSEYCANSIVINEKYCHDHWMVRVRPTQPINKDKLLSINEYKSLKTDNMFHMIKYLLKTN